MKITLYRGTVLHEGFPQFLLSRCRVTCTHERFQHERNARLRQSVLWLRLKTLTLWRSRDLFCACFRHRISAQLRHLNSGDNREGRYPGGAIGMNEPRTENDNQRSGINETIISSYQSDSRRKGGRGRRLRRMRTRGELGNLSFRKKTQRRRPLSTEWFLRLICFRSELLCRRNNFSRERGRGRGRGRGGGTLDVAGKSAASCHVDQINAEIMAMQNWLASC